MLPGSVSGHCPRPHGLPCPLRLCISLPLPLPKAKPGAQRRCENAPAKASTGVALTAQEALVREVNHVSRTCPLESFTFVASMLPAYFFARPFGIIDFFQTLLL